MRREKWGGWGEKKAPLALAGPNPNTGSRKKKKEEKNHSLHRGKKDPDGASHLLGKGKKGSQPSERNDMKTKKKKKILSFGEKKKRGEMQRGDTVRAP